MTLNRLPDFPSFRFLGSCRACPSTVVFVVDMLALSNVSRRSLEVQ